MTPILSIDPARTSGWALVRESGWRTGVAKTASERFAVVANAVLAPGLVVVMETWKLGGGRGGRPRTTSTIVGLGAARGRWLEQLELAGHPKRRVVSVDLGTWSQCILGRSRLTTAQRDAMVRMRARATLGREVSDDEADAVAIALWAMRAPEVAKLGGKQ